MTRQDWDYWSLSGRNSPRKQGKSLKRTVRYGRTDGGDGSPHTGLRFAWRWQILLSPGAIPSPWVGLGNSGG